MESITAYRSAVAKGQKKTIAANARNNKPTGPPTVRVHTAVRNPDLARAISAQGVPTLSGLPLATWRFAQQRSSDEGVDMWLQGISEQGKTLATLAFVDRILTCFGPSVPSSASASASASTLPGNDASNSGSARNLDGGGGTMQLKPRLLRISHSRDMAQSNHNLLVKYTEGTGIVPELILGSRGRGRHKNVKTRLKCVHPECQVVSVTPGMLKSMVDDEQMTFDNLKYLVFEEPQILLRDDTVKSIFFNNNNDNDKTYDLVRDGKEVSRLFLTGTVPPLPCTSDSIACVVPFTRKYHTGKNPFYTWVEIEVPPQ